MNSRSTPTPVPRAPTRPTISVEEWEASAPLNAAIPAWAQGLNKTESPIWVVDQYTGYSGSTDNRDGIHPNAAGDTKMMNVWYPALIQAFAAAKADKAAVAGTGDVEVREERWVA